MRPPRIPSATKSGPGGFTIVEVIVSMLVLTIGVAAFSGSAIMLIRQLSIAEVSTNRALAQQEVAAEISALDFIDIQPVLEADAVVKGDFSFWWDVETTDFSGLIYKTISGTVRGPGIRSGQVSQDVEGSFMLRIVAP